MSTTRSDAVRDRLQQLVDAESALDDTACLLRVEVPGVGGWSVAAGPVARGARRAEIDAPFRTASITKSFTAVAVLQLAAEGRLSLDDPMVEHLPAEVLDLVPLLHVVDGVSYGERLTVRRLLDHSAGLFDYATSDGFIGAIIEDPARVWTPRSMLEGHTHWGVPLFPPGEGYGYAYSDTGYVLLGLIIERLDGRPLHESYRARIVEPLGLRATYLEGHEPHRGPELTHTHEGEHDTSVIHGTADWAGGGLVSDLDDLTVFARALVDGTLVAGRWLDELLHWEFRTLDSARHSHGFLGYSCGVEARSVHGLLMRGHRGHWGAWMHVHPESGLTVTGTINQAARRPDGIVFDAVEAVLSAGLVDGWTMPTTGDGR